MKRRIAIIVGSASDLSQCQEGFKFLQENAESVEVVGINVRSQHRNTLDAQELLKKLVSSNVDVAIIGAGWANHLTGCSDAFLRYTLRDDKLLVIGVAFSDPDNPIHTRAATLSMTEVPGTQVHCRDKEGFVYVGTIGFMKACTFAAHGQLPKIKLPEPKPIADMTLQEALQKT